MLRGGMDWRAVRRLMLGYLQASGLHTQCLPILTHLLLSLFLASLD